MLLVGEWNRYEWIAAAAAAAVAATIGELARSSAGVSFRVPLRVATESWSVLYQLFVDMWIITSALVQSVVRREIVRGSFRTHPFDAGGDDRRSIGMRAWTGWA